mmetsp:Transcript_15220/g.45459  ORF Transcript_15220/g.45459 Transcript_15220/m.45459 type:complete len:209 (+) Transcript_15220:198-824(+)
MVVRVDYKGPWPPEKPPEAFASERFTVKATVTRCLPNVQLLKAARGSGHLRNNPGPENIRTCAAISLSVDTATASEDEAMDLERLQRRMDRVAPTPETTTVYVPATRLAALKAESSETGEALVCGDVVEATIVASTAPYATTLDVISRVKRTGAGSAHASTNLYGANKAVDVDSGGLADRIMAVKVSAPAPAPADAGEPDVADDEWDD